MLMYLCGEARQAVVHEQIDDHPGVVVGRIGDPPCQRDIQSGMIREPSCSHCPRTHSKMDEATIPNQTSQPLTTTYRYMR